jgi:hypothetical protein
MAFSDHGATAFARRQRSFPAVTVSSDRGPSDLGSTVQIRRYRFDWIFAKETPHFFILEPTVQNVKTRIRFILLKAYLVSVIQKYVFTYLQFCH